MKCVPHGLVEEVELHNVVNAGLLGATVKLALGLGLNLPCCSLDFIEREITSGAQILEGQRVTVIFRMTSLDGEHLFGG